MLLPAINSHTTVRSTDCSCFCLCVQRLYLRKQLGGDEKKLSSELLHGRLPSAFHNVMVCVLGEYRAALRPSYALSPTSSSPSSSPPAVYCILYSFHLI